MPCTGAKPTWLGFFQSVAGCPLSVFSSFLLHRHHCQRGRNLSKACIQASQKWRVWKSHLLPQDYHQLQAVRMLPSVRFFMESKLSGFCIFRMELQLLISLQICLISPICSCFICNQTLVLICKQWETSCSEICCNNIQSNTWFQLNCKPL